MRGLTLFLLLAICALSSGAILKRGVKENSFIEVNVGGEQVETIFDEEDISDDDDGLSDDDDQDEFDDEEEDNEEIDEDEEEEFDDEEDEEIDDDDDEEFEDSDSEIEDRKKKRNPTKCGSKIIKPGKSIKIRYVFTKGYPMNANWEWNISTSSDAILEMKCRVKQIRKTPDCKRDFVQIGSKKFCGKLKRTLKAGSSVTIKFESKTRKRRHRNKGFACKVTAMKPVDKPDKLRDCAEHLIKGDKSSGMKVIYPWRHDLNKSELVYCDQTTDGGGWTVIQKREKTNNRENFYRKWIDYKSGFGDRNSEFWLGNDLIHEITSSKSQQLRVDLGDYDGDSRYAKYRQFNVDDESKKYRLTVSNYTGTAGDSLEYHNGYKFSTHDQDNDSSSLNCAAEYNKGAWWYKHCARSNLNGYQHEGNTTEYEGIYWVHWRGYHYSLKTTTMMVKPQTL